MQIFTIGHSVTKFDDFYNILKAFKIDRLFDVRSHPGSRYVPQYNKEDLAIELKKHGIDYVHFRKLGGRRKSNNQVDYTLVDGWRNQSFRNYASYTLTEEYNEGIKELISEASKDTICIMCAESVPWRCHRLLISNTLSNLGIEVIHILDKEHVIIHQLNKYGANAVSKDGKIIYPKA